MSDLHSIDCESVSDALIELQNQMMWESKVDIHSAYIPDINNKSVINFKPGVVSRYEPGLYIVDDSYKIISDKSFNSSIFNNLDYKSCDMYGNMNYSASHIYATYRRLHEPGYVFPPTKELRFQDCDNLDIATIILDGKMGSIDEVSSNSTEDIFCSVHLTKTSTTSEYFPGLVIYTPTGCRGILTTDRVRYRSVNTDSIFDPSPDVIRHMSDLGYIILTDIYDLFTPELPTVIYLPDDEIIAEHMKIISGYFKEDLENEIRKIHEFIAELNANKDKLIDDKQCVVVIKSNLDHPRAAHFVHDIEA